MTRLSIWMLAIALSGCSETGVVRRTDPSSTRFELHPVATLHSDVPGMELMPGSEVIRDARGRYFVAPVVTPGAIAVFDSAGSFLKLVGRTGNGPGELQEITRIRLGPGDSVLVLDSNRRITVIGPDLLLIRSIQLSTPGGISDFEIAVPDRLFAATLAMYGRSVDRISILDLDTGTELGVGGGSESGDTIEARYSSLLAERSAVIWAARSDARELDRLGQSGNLLSRFVLARGNGPCSNSPPEGTSTPKLSRLGRSASGMIWLLLWQRLPVNPVDTATPDGSVRTLTTGETQQLNSVWLEGFDPTQRSIVVCQQFERVVPRGFVDDDLVYALRDDATGSIVVDVLRIVQVGGTDEPGK